MMIKRHSRISIFIHWFNATCWLFLLVTGIGLIDNRDLQPIGEWWVDFMHGLFGNGETLLLAHEICGLVWIGVLLVLGIIFIRSETLPFTKNILTFSPASDLMWLLKKILRMTLGYRVTKRLGFDPAIPDQGFYNAGQKLFGITVVVGGGLLAVTGIIMMLSKICFSETAIVQWSILIHFIAAGVVFAGFLIHIYMSSIARGQLPGLISILTGNVPATYAEKHHKFWFEAIKGSHGQE